MLLECAWSVTRITSYFLQNTITTPLQLDQYIINTDLDNVIVRSKVEVMSQKICGFVLNVSATVECEIALSRAIPHSPRSGRTVSGPQWITRHAITGVLVGVSIMAAPLIASHEFTTSVCERARSFDSVNCKLCKRWHGGIKCDTCQQPKFDHQTKEAIDYRYSSWSVSMALRDEISQAWTAMHDYRKSYQSAKERNFKVGMDSYGMLAETCESQVRMLLRIHNYGLGRYSPMECEHLHSCRAPMSAY